MGVPFKTLLTLRAHRTILALCLGSVYVWNIAAPEGRP